MKNPFAALALVVAIAVTTTAEACEYCLIGQGISPLLTQNGAGFRVARVTRGDGQVSE